MQYQNSPSLPANVSRQELREIVRSQLLALLEQEDLRGAKALLVPVDLMITQLP